MLETEHKMGNILVGTIRKSGLRYEDQSPLKLALVADYSYDRASSSWVAISLRLELHEPVKILRKLPVGWESGRTAVTWTMSTVDVVPLSRAESTLLARTQAAADLFVYHVKLVSGGAEKRH